MPSAPSAHVLLWTAATISAAAVAVSLIISSDDPNGTIGTLGGCGLVAVLLGHLYRLRVGEYERGRQSGYDEGYKDGRRQPLGPVVTLMRQAPSMRAADGVTARAAAKRFGSFIDELSDQECERRPG